MTDSKDRGLRKGHVAVRLDAATIARLDALLSLYALPGRHATRSDGLRAVILAGLAVEEQRLPKAPGESGVSASDPHVTLGTLARGAHSSGSRLDPLVARASRSAARRSSISSPARMTARNPSERVASRPGSA